MPRGDEAWVVAAFAAYLSGAGWSVETEVKFVDLVARRGAETIYAEAKGRTAATGLDVNTLYGQLLTRMPQQREDGARYAVVLPADLLRFAERVKPRVRALLDIDLYGVADDGTVTLEPI